MKSGAMQTEDKKKSKEIEYEKERRRHRRFKNALRGAVMSWMRRNFDMRLDPIEPDDGRPAIIAANHASVYDFLFVTAANPEMDLSYVASEHILRIKPWGQILSRYASIIPYRKGAGASRSAVKILEKLSLGESVYLAAEGEQTWNGITMDIKPGIGKLAKKSGASLITYRLEGTYLIRPRWARNLRRGTVNGRLAAVYTPEMLSGMSAEEIDEAVARDLYFDMWKWQIEDNTKALRYKPVRGGNADGISRALCSCPECGRIGHLVDEGDEIRCRCGFKTVLKKTGFFRQKDGKGPADIAEWEKLDERAIAGAIARAREAGGEIFSDSGTALYSLNKDHTEEELCRGRVALRAEDGRLILRTEAASFDLAEIYDMTMVQMDRLLFSVGSDYYEIRSDTANLRKYMQAYNLQQA